MRVTAEKCSTHSRQNPTIRPEGRTGYRGSGRVPRTRGWLILPPWDKTNSQARPPPPPTRGSWWDAGTFGGAAGNGLDGNKARREVSRLGQRREYGTEGQKRALGGLGAAARDPPKIDHRSNVTSPGTSSLCCPMPCGSRSVILTDSSTARTTIHNHLPCRVAFHRLSSSPE